MTVASEKTQSSGNERGDDTHEPAVTELFDGLCGSDDCEDD
jgi:hypothetical protein